MFRKYSPEEYPKYDNYDAINVDKTCDIPEDYDGAMGVPISFLNKYNPNQFEIIGNELPILDGSSAGFVEKLLEAEVVELNEEVEPIVITEPVIFSDEKNGKYVMALPYDKFKISYTIDFKHSFLNL